MDYKKEIISMIQKIESVRFLAMIYSFTHTLFEKERSREINPCFFLFGESFNELTKQFFVF